MGSPAYNFHLDDDKASTPPVSPDWAPSSPLSTDHSVQQITILLGHLSRQLEVTAPLIPRATYLRSCLASVSALLRGESWEQPDQVPLEDPKVLLRGMYKETYHLLCSLDSAKKEHTSLHREWAGMHLEGVFDYLYHGRIHSAHVFGGVDGLANKKTIEEWKRASRQGRMWLREWETNVGKLKEAEAEFALMLGWVGAEMRRVENYVVVFPGAEGRWEWFEQTREQGERGAVLLHDAEENPDFGLTREVEAYIE